MRKRKYSKIYIIGSSMSAKASLAHTLSRRMNIKAENLDEILYDRNKSGNPERPVKQRELLFATLIHKDQWIIFDVGRPCFDKALHLADRIILFDIPTSRAIFYFWSRWVISLFNFSQKNRQSLKKVRMAIDSYKQNRENFMKRLQPFHNKITYIKDFGKINPQ